MKSYKSFYEAYDRDSLVIKDSGVFETLYDIWWAEVDPYIESLKEPDIRLLLRLIHDQPDGRPSRPGFRVIGDTNELDFHTLMIGNWPPSPTLGVQDLEEYEAEKLVMIEKVLGETTLPATYLFKGQRWLMSDVKKWWFKNLQDYNTYNTDQGNL